jgi:predicted amidophosphoribosyltransferase
MKLCPNCKTFQPNIDSYCSECGTELLRNEASSEDADEGKFQEPIGGEE